MYQSTQKRLAQTPHLHSQLNDVVVKDTCILRTYSPTHCAKIEEKTGEASDRWGKKQMALNGR
jgi:hypothetical protein